MIKLNKVDRHPWVQVHIEFSRILLDNDLMKKRKDCHFPRDRYAWDRSALDPEFREAAFETSPF
jgi:hypothetical protein